MSVKSFCWIFVFMLLSVFVISACQSDQTDTGGARGTESESQITEAKVERVKNLWLEAQNENKLELLDSLYTPESAIQIAGAQKDICGTPMAKQYYQGVHEAFPDLKFEIDDVRPAGDWIVWKWKMQGTNTGSFRGMEPTGKEVVIYGVTINRFEDGMVSEEWAYFDVADFYRQLGYEIVPPQPKGEEGK
jgi:steroid delta-isomerase-like uncharacterized protein